MADAGQIDFATRAWNAAIDHAPLVAFLAVAGWKGLPLVLTKFFNNGGGLQIRALVAEENKEQTKLHNEATAKLVADEIAKHRLEEKADLEERLSDLRMEITGEYPLMPPERPARPRLRARVSNRRPRR